MNKSTVLAVTLLVGCAVAHGDSADSTTAGQHLTGKSTVTDATLSRFIGVWDMQLMTHVETFGDMGGPGHGTMVCHWGLMNAWVDCDMDSVYEGFGRYTLKIVLHRMARDGSIGAFVTNSFGGGRLYVGHWENGTALKFRDAWVDPAMKWEYQRTEYTFPGADSIEYRIGVSKDNETYLPHSSGIYTRR